LEHCLPWFGTFGSKADSTILYTLHTEPPLCVSNGVSAATVMESHYFSEATLCGEASHTIPTWMVHVIRCKGDVTVGTLTVNAETLSPRLNPKTKKCLWKLPDSISVLPRFGEHEKKRLWELYKEHKKERRRKSKDDENSATDAPSPNTPPSERSCSVHGMAALTLADSAALQTSLGATTTTTTPRRPSAACPLPPPGFATSPISTAQAAAGPPPPTTTTPTPTTTAQTVTTRLPSSFPVAVDHSHHEQAYFVVPFVPAESPPPPLLADDDDDDDDDDRAMAIGSIVAGAFLETMASLAMEPSSVPTLSSSSSAALEVWLAHYSRTATKSLLLGSATAKANAPELIRQQWQSLMAPGCVWQCHGWIAQAVVGSSLSLNDHHTKNGDGPPLPRSDQQQPRQPRDMATLVTFTGQTLQPGTGWLCYTLTLLVHPVTSTATPMPPAQPNDTRSSSRHHVIHHVIVNDIMTLQPLTLPAAGPTDSVCHVDSRTTNQHTYS
jgi:hypothetical protein